jgi:hypothetical protein
MYGGQAMHRRLPEMEAAMPLRPNVCAAVGVVLAVGCGSLQSDPSNRGVTLEHGAFVITGEDLSDGRGDVLNAMIGKVPNFRVQRPSMQTCPQITIRNATSYATVVNPHVYVDGTRSQDTCILESLRTSDVDRVEVYPAGFTNRPGYGRHAHGLILVFMRGAEPDASLDLVRRRGAH